MSIRVTVFTSFFTLLLFITATYASCGTAVSPEPSGSSTLVSGGTVVDRIQDPNSAEGSAVAIARKISGSDFKVFCSGTLISRLHVLTAAHCIESTVISSNISVQETLYIRFGVSDFVYIPVSRIVPHPLYDEALPVNESVQSPPNDLAVLRLADFAPSRASPARLPSADIALPKQFMIAGFGVSALRTAADTGVLRTARVDLKRSSMTRLTFDTAGGSYAAPVGGCAGDSGAPLFQEGNAVFGVLSTGAEVAGKCMGTNTFTDTRFYLNWISDTLAGDSESLNVLSIGASSVGVAFSVELFKKSLTENHSTITVALSRNQLKEAELKDCHVKIHSQSRMTEEEHSGKLLSRTWVSPAFDFSSTGGVRFQAPGIGAVPFSYSLGIDITCAGQKVTPFPSAFVL